MTKVETIQFLRNLELFRELQEDEFETLLTCTEERRYAPGEFLFRQNAPRINLFVICRGGVELVKQTALGNETRLGFFSTGDFLGESSWGSTSPHSTSARAVADTLVLIVHRGFLSESPSATVKVLSRVIRVMARRMQGATNRVIDAGAQYESGKTRPEKDLLGERNVPYEAYYGIQTLRALENFNISGIALNFYPLIISSLAMVKEAAARANRDLGLLDSVRSAAIIAACREVANGKLHSHFTVDMIQGGAGTSTNMNANEVIANRALELLGHNRGEYRYCHPNNHVNLSQSTNDAYPTAVKIALVRGNGPLIQVLRELIQSFRRKGQEFVGVIKMGRTQLQDAVPMTLGQTFEAYAVTLEEEILRLEENSRLFLEVNLGGTAIGTGINADPAYANLVIRHLREITGLEVVRAENLVEATQDTGSFVMYSMAVKRLAIKLSKICNDLRLLSSGPRAGLGEINLPPLQPGSSIMPGKVNPVIPEVVNQVAFKVMGNDLTVSIAAEAGQLELNVMEPVIVQSLVQSVEMLKNAMVTLKARCIDGITANEAHCRQTVLNSIGLVTALTPALGYERCSLLAREALEQDRGVYDLVLEQGLLDRETLDALLSPEGMVEPGSQRPLRRNDHPL